jgi:hypothetical protein
MASLLLAKISEKYLCEIGCMKYQVSRVGVLILVTSLCFRAWLSMRGTPNNLKKRFGPPVFESKN